jgi:hypothetical protein
MRKKLLVACLLAPAALYGQVAGIGLKPGLWEVRVVRQVVDGRDISAQLSAAASQMQQALQNMPPEQRAQMEGMLKQHRMGRGDEGYRICVTPEMARRDTPILDKEGRCRMSKVVHNGQRTSFAFSCSANGTTTTGTGVADLGSERVTTRTDATTQDEKGEKHTIQVESQMKYVKADCGALEPSGPRR